MFVRYLKTQKLGEGTYGSVFRAQDQETGEIVALKQVKMDQEEDGVPASALREATILRNLHHTNIVTLKEIGTDNGMLIIITEFMDKNLKDFLFSLHKKPLTPAILRSYTYQILSGLNYMHSTGYIHRDLKPSNILLDKNGFLKICNFRKSHIYHHPMKRAHFEIPANIWYHAPELLSEMPTYDYGIDVWAAGCIIAQMAKGEVIIRGDSPIDQLIHTCGLLGIPSEWPEFVHAVHNLFPKFKAEERKEKEVIEREFDALFPGEVDRRLVDLLLRMLAVNPACRITAREALKHDYFKEMPSSIIEICSFK